MRQQILIVLIRMLNKELDPYVVIDNEDDSFYVFLKCLVADKTLTAFDAMRCRRIAPPPSYGSTIKRISIEFQPMEGDYEIEYKENYLLLCFKRGEPKLTTECRKIQYIKELKIYGKFLDIVKEFTQHIFSLAEKLEDANMITIYENNSNYWNTVKTKKKRALNSVFLHEKFVEDILEDVQEFIDSEEWYTSMGIPYKRSYLLYGPPGSGKSSLAQAIAGAVNFSICYLNMTDQINDFSLNVLLNSAPKKSIILIEDVDAIFSNRKSTQKNNLSFSGFLNAIDGVRSQEGRIIIMSTNFKERLDPALLRPGRTDQAYEIGLATQFQIQKMCLRFFGNEELARAFAQQIPDGKFSMSMIQGYLVKHRKNPEKILTLVEDLLLSDENVPIERFLQEINCQSAANSFRLEECYNLAQAKCLPKVELEKIVSSLSAALAGRLINVVRSDRKSYLKSYAELETYIIEVTDNEELQHLLRAECQKNGYSTFYQVKDKLSELKSSKKE